MAPFSTTLDLNQSGTWTLEDDGVAGNGISRLRRPDGSSFLVEHPTNLLKFTASEPGVALVFDLTGVARQRSPGRRRPRQLHRLSGSIVLGPRRVEQSDHAGGDRPDHRERCRRRRLARRHRSILDHERRRGDRRGSDQRRHPARRPAGPGPRGRNRHRRDLARGDMGDLVIGGLTSSVAGLDVATSGELFLSNFGSIGSAIRPARKSSTAAAARAAWRCSPGAPARASRPTSTTSRSSRRSAWSGWIRTPAISASAADRRARSTMTSAAVTAWSWKRAATSFSTATPTVVADPFGLDLPFTSQALVAARNITLAGGASVAAADPNFGDVRLLTAPGGEIFLAAPGARPRSRRRTSSTSRPTVSGWTRVRACRPRTASFATTSNYRPIALVGGAEPANALGLSSVELNRMFGKPHHRQRV